jgi:ABC-type polysaccharide/polyol phosphate transport system ATPase subunit
MASIELTDLGLTFTLRRTVRPSLKDYLLHKLWLSRVNPKVNVHALTGVNLSARDGDRVGVIGHNGAGKSTLLKVLAGVYPPTSGSRRVDGKICSLFDITLGFESDASGRENILYRGYLQGETPRTIRRKMDEIADFTELGGFLDTPVRYYSAGMMIRLAFAIATAAEPEVLLVDEVLSVGDMAFQAKARKRMDDMMASASLMVMVSHDFNTIASICNKAIWLEKGEVRMAGPAKAVCAAYEKDAKGASAAKAA